MTCTCLHDRPLTCKKAADYLSYKPETLKAWARKKKPDLKPFKRNGRKRVYYHFGGQRWELN